MLSTPIGPSRRLVHAHEGQLGISDCLIKLIVQFFDLATVLPLDDEQPMVN